MHASLFNYLSIYLSNLVLTPAALQILLERGIINNKTSREVKISLVSVSLFIMRASIHTNVDRRVKFSAGIAHRKHTQ